MIHVSNLWLFKMWLLICSCTMPDFFWYLFMQVQCGDAELVRKIDEKIDQFIDRVEKHPNKKNQVHWLPQSLTFFTCSILDSFLFKDHVRVKIGFNMFNLVKHK